jgi:hypothetical protein
MLARGFLEGVGPMAKKAKKKAKKKAAKKKTAKKA